MTVEVRVVVVCRQCQVAWDHDQEPRCRVQGHSHHDVELHRHRSVVTLPDGTRLTAVSFDERDPYARAQPPDYGLYLDIRWQPPWSHEHLTWPDFGVPSDNGLVIATLRSLMARARAGEHVELGCLGGHGRTGSALAILAVLSGLPADGAVAWVRANYCSKAVETPEQEGFVRQLGNEG